MQKKSIFGLLVLSSVAVGCVNSASTPNVLMQKVTGLKTPESVVQAKDGAFLCQKSVSLVKMAMEKSP